MAYGASEQPQKVGEAIPCVNKCDKGYRCQIFPHSFCSELHGHRLLSLSLSLSSLHALLARNTRNGETGGNLVKSWVIPLSWDFLVSTLAHPSKELHIATLFRASFNDVGDKFVSAPAGLGFRRRGAPERRNGTKR